MSDKPIKKYAIFCQILWYWSWVCSVFNTTCCILLMRRVWRRIQNKPNCHKPPKWGLRTISYSQHQSRGRSFRLWCSCCRHLPEMSTLRWNLSNPRPLTIRTTRRHTNSSDHSNSYKSSADSLPNSLTFQFQSGAVSCGLTLRFNFNFILNRTSATVNLQFNSWPIPTIFSKWHYYFSGFLCISQCSFWKYFILNNCL